MEGLVCLIVVPALLIMVPLLWWLAIYNRLVRLRQHVHESWSDIDVQLKRRHELIPNLVETVRGYANHERELFERVVELRNRADASSNLSNLSRDESALQRGVAQLFAVAENYPQLRASEQFLALQEELALTEDRIAAARRFYNANVRDLNSLCQQFPSRLVASAGGFQRADYFELDRDAERVAMRIQL